MKEQEKRINVYIITGFLGAGKTTLLNHLLKQFQLSRNVVIENEFGKINIDATLVNENYESVFELTNGCICCSINNQLLETLNNINSLPNKPDNIFIETTGIADAGEIAANFTPLYMYPIFSLKKIITVIDAENFFSYRESNAVITKQIVAADCILINKETDENSILIEVIKKEVQSMNPFAKIHLSTDGFLDWAYLKTKNADKVIHSNGPQNIEVGHKIKTVLYETDDLFDIQKLKYELFRHLFLYYHQIYRIKGYVLDESKQVFLVQTVGKTVTISPKNKIIIGKSQLVFIGKEITDNTIKRIVKGTNIKLAS